jgi:subtilisin-like proprotein convertase family protein
MPSMRSEYRRVLVATASIFLAVGRSVSVAQIDGAGRPGGQSGSIRSGHAEMSGSEQMSRSLFVMRDMHLPASLNQEPMVRPAAGQAVVVDHANIGKLLDLAPMEFTEAATQKPLIIALPDPDGQWQRFAVVKTKLMEDKLANEFPDIRVIVGQGIDDPHAILRADVTMHGFQAQVLTPNGDWFIDPISRGNPLDHTSYYRKFTRMVHKWACEVTAEDQENAAQVAARGGDTANRSGPTLRTHRIAVAATAEYTAFFGGTVAAGQAAIVTAMNRVTGVYEREVGVRFVLVANNSSLVYTNATTDPYTNGSGGAMLGENQTNITNVIGTANYDVGHVFSTGGGGVATLNSVCSSTNKARGVSGQPSPNNDPFWIDYVAHEIGHQYGGQHCFNSSTGSCSGNRSSANAMEIGSGTTIMAYAGICGSDNVQPNSDAYFHSISFDNILASLAASSGTCGTTIATGNFAPSVSGPGNFSIPTGTPFFLTASATDANNDPLTYCWEDRALGPSITLATADNGTSPLVRSRNPSTSATRFVPQLSTVLAGTADNLEKLPAVGRTWPWRVTARDNRAGGGGVNTADATLTVVGGTGPFRVTSQSSNVTWPIGSTQTVNWDVAGTTANGINTANVAIELTTNGGATWSTLVTSTPNDGSHAFTVTGSPTTSGRLRVRAINNIYYAVAPGTISLTGTPAGVVLAPTGPVVASDSVGLGNNNGNGRIDPGENTILITLPIVNSGATTATPTSGVLNTSTPTVSIVQGTSNYGTLATNGQSNGSAYQISVAPTHPCGEPINLSFFVSSPQGGAATFNFTLPTGQASASGVNTITYSGAPVAIFDNQTINVPLTVSVLGTSLTDVDLRIEGSSCSATGGSTTVGLEHTYIGDLEISLVSPQGTVVLLSNNRGAGGNNMCNTVFSDGAPNGIASITAGQAPFTGTFNPESPLSAFNGQNPNGTWFLRVLDNANGDVGNVRAFSLRITTPTQPTCQPPLDTPCPSISQQPISAQICATSTIDLSVVASGVGSLSYQWKRNGMDLVNDARISGVNSPNLVITNPQPGDLGAYTVLVGNACPAGGTLSSAATISSACLSRSDIGSEGGGGGCDGLLDNNDFIVFINLFFVSDPRADVGIEGGATGSDQLFDNNDFIVFIDGFFQGCQ